MRQFVLLGLMASCTQEQRVLEPIELPFNLGDVTRIVAQSAHDDSVTLARRTRDDFLAAGVVRAPREVPRNQYARLFGVITWFVVEEDGGTACLPFYRDYLDLYDAYGMRLMTIDICFACGDTIMTGPLGRTYHAALETPESSALAAVMASVGYTENLPDAYFVHLAHAGAAAVH